MATAAFAGKKGAQQKRVDVTKERFSMQPTANPPTRTGPKLRPRYCSLCGTKCEGAVVAANHCKGKGMRPVRGKGRGKGSKNLSQ